MLGMNGIEVLEKMRADDRWQAVPVIMVTARSTTEDLVQGLDAGADDYVTKPIDEAELFARIRAMLRIARLERENTTLSQENTSLREQLDKGAAYEGVVGKSQRMQQVYALVSKVVSSDTTVLVRGETGTGKEVLARTIHHEGPRGEKPFVTVNCGAMAENILESELFGHKKGAFTGAVNDRPGSLRRPMAARSFWTRLAKLRRLCRCVCCARFKKGRSAASARNAIARSMCASSPRRIAI